MLHLPLNAPGNVGKFLGPLLSAKLPIVDIPTNPAPQWFRRNSNLVDPPGEPLPLDREAPKKRDRTKKGRDMAVVDQICHELGIHGGGGPSTMGSTHEQATSGILIQHPNVAGLRIGINTPTTGRSDRPETSRNEDIEREMVDFNITDVAVRQSQQLHDEFVAYKVQVEEREKQILLKSSTLEAEKNDLVADMARLRSKLHEATARSSKYEADVVALREEVHKLHADRETMMLGTVLSAARAKQYEAESSEIASEWTSNHRLRALLLTSWPTAECMYPTNWDDVDPSVFKANGSIDWMRVAEPDHHWNIDEKVGGTDDVHKTWRYANDMTQDGSKCAICQSPWGPEGCYTLGTCGHSYHPQCLIEDMIRKRTCTVCKSPYHARLYLQFGLKDFMPVH